MAKINIQKLDEGIKNGTIKTFSKTEYEYLSKVVYRTNQIFLSLHVDLRTLNGEWMYTVITSWEYGESHDEPWDIERVLDFANSFPNDPETVAFRNELLFNLDIFS